MTVAVGSPRLAVAVKQQQSIGTTSLPYLLEPKRKLSGNRHRATVDGLVTAFAARRHHQACVGPVGLYVANFKPTKLAHSGTGDGGKLNQQGKFWPLMLRGHDDVAHRLIGE